MPRLSKLEKARLEVLEKLKTPKQTQLVRDLPKECEVSYCGGELAREERETSISWTEASKLAEITTSSPKWIRRLEKKGCIPTSVSIFDNCETRTYLVPKRYVSYTQRTKKNAEAPEED